MIHLLLPSRGRPENVRRLFRSLLQTTRNGAWRMVVALDADDPTREEYPRDPQIVYLVADRMLLSEYWNVCYRHAAETAGPDDVFMHAGDDITFRTVDWDQIVTAAFPEDGIAFVHGDDLSPNGRTLGTHGFLRREWVETLGYFVPPYFSSDCNDAWLTEVADHLGRRVYVPIISEHHHPAFGKAEWDLTHRERLERHKADDITAIWWAKAPDRLMDAAKLRARMVNP